MTNATQTKTREELRRAVDVAEELYAALKTANPNLPRATYKASVQCAEAHAALDAYDDDTQQDLT
jgi:hypothetical protein